MGSEMCIRDSAYGWLVLSLFCEGYIVCLYAPFNFGQLSDFSTEIVDFQNEPFVLRNVRGDPPFVLIVEANPSGNLRRTNV